MDNLKTITAQRLLHTLSPAFAACDDAARYALAQVDRQAAYSQGGYILNADDGRCYASAPLRGSLDELLFEDAISMESSRDRRLPAGYRYVGYYFFDIDRHAQIARLRPAWSADSIALQQSVAPAKAVVSCIQLGVVFYRIGPEGSLVRFGLIDRPGVADYFHRLNARIHAEPEPVLEASAEEYVRRLRDFGQLKVIVTSAIWAGWRGTLTPKWKAYVPDPVPATPDPWVSPIFPDAASALAFAHPLMMRHPTVLQIGFLLKHQHVENYMVTEPVAVSANPFDPAAVFPTTPDGRLIYSCQCDIVGVYSFAPDRPAPETAKEPWLYERFFSPRMLAEALWLAHGLKKKGFTYYLSTFDGAQLRYTVADPQAPMPFFNPLHSSTQPIDNGLQADLDKGALTPSDFVRQLRSTGQLHVLKTSSLWDVAARVGRDWQPYAGLHRPVLSPAFVQADDAARHAHERIGSRRERGYLGLILKRDDQRFVATEPMAFKGERFDFHRYFPADRSGLPVALTSGQVLHGVYSSRWLDDYHGHWEGDEARVGAQMFMDTDIQRILAMPGLPVAYLSGSADCLLAYRPYLPDMTHRLLERAQPGEGGSRLFQALNDGTLVPSDVVSEMTLSGLLSVVVGNRIWGPPGPLDSRWVPAGAADLAEVPGQPQLGPVHTSARAAVEAACTHWRSRYGLDHCGLGLVLKHQARDEFVATQTVGGPRLDRLYHASRFGATALTATFQVHAVYYSARGLPHGVMGQEAWLARHFIGALDFYAALYDQQGVRRGVGLAPLPLYLSTLDGALLEYRTQQDPHPLFKNESGQVDEQVLAKKLALTLTPHSLVQQVAQSGQLSVLVTSDYWDVSGPVGALWTPFAQVARRLLGPVFISQDDAARHALFTLGSRRDRVYGGLILRRSDGLFTATEPLPVGVEDFAPSWIRLDELVNQARFLAASTAVARYHSAVACEPPFGLADVQRAVYLDMFASDFLGAVLRPSTVPLKHTLGCEYRFCTDGAILCYTVRGGALEHSLASQVASASRNHPKDNRLEQALRDCQLTPVEYVNRVARAGMLRVVQGSAVWGRPRQIRQWEPGTAQDLLEPVMMDTGTSAVFVQLPDLLHYLHRQAAQRRHLVFGLILKARKAAHYLGSFPLVAADAALTLDRVFVDGLAPQGYDVQGLYLCPPVQPDILASDPIYPHFVSPRDLARVVNLKGPNGQGYLPIYLGCTDGAWLTFERRDPQAFVPQVATAWSRLQAGTLKPQAYVRQVAAAWPMTVLVTSGLWHTPGAVSPQWRMNSPAPVVSRAAALRFGPLFCHPDDAARHARHRAGRFERHAFVGLVLVDERQTLYVAAEPLKDEGIESPVPQRLFLYADTLLGPSPPKPAYPAGFQLLAAHVFYKTMGARRDWAPADQQLGEHFVARDELGFYRNLLKVGGVKGAFCYLSTRQGALLKYVPGFYPQEEDLFTGQLFFGPDDYAPTAWVARLATDGVLDVLDTDDYWTRKGVVKVNWTLSVDEQPPPIQVQPTHPEKDEF
ncbi:hypothetical protein [Pseudomonas sp. AF03-9]|uniref:hypothetical protein n=1 Tax=Pseudomonas sp. AF03-9 TaxID=2849867 RepID=UPI001CF92F18|nr:hypothetical protein [Pseudomonas sp. AF03-9]